MEQEWETDKLNINLSFDWYQRVHIISHYTRDLWGSGTSTQLWLPLLCDEKEISLLVLITPRKSQFPPCHRADRSDLLLPVTAKVKSAQAIKYLTHLIDAAATKSSS